MGEIADAMLNGEMCHQCGVWLEEFLETGKPLGYPALCEDCKKEEHNE